MTEVRNPDAPHTATVCFRVDVYEMNEAGQAIPPLHRVCNAYEVLTGKNYKELEEKIEAFKEVYQNAKAEYEQSVS